jgi:hypothetical protein
VYVRACASARGWEYEHRPVLRLLNFIALFSHAAKQPLLRLVRAAAVLETCLHYSAGAAGLAELSIAIGIVWWLRVFFYARAFK